LLDDSTGQVQTASTSSFGVYSFQNLAPDHVYTVTVRNKRYRFSPQILSPTASLANVDFFGLEWFARSQFGSKEGKGRDVTRGLFLLPA
jgi:hypothetical protein